MLRFIASLSLAFVLTAPAYAALAVGASAPDFTAPATIAGKPFTFSLAEALKRGPVVLYFYPKAFTRGCTYEANEFAKATDAFAELGATVVGVSNDGMDVLNKFSVGECNGKFAVVSDPQAKVISAYRTHLWTSGNADRVTYVIVPDGKVIFVHADMHPEQHVALSLTALKKWKAGK